ncbi:MAG: hypothetical protein JNN15_00655 [Blastocatellia bacterium]|nr:hypothetical protein [Blastocatellia bacterium]
MWPDGIQIFIGVEQSQGDGYEPIGSFITGTADYYAARERAKEKAYELLDEFPDEGEWYAFVSDEFGNREIL